MDLTEKLSNDILYEIARLSLIIAEETNIEEARGLAIILNSLVAVLLEHMSISDFHDFISDAPEKIRIYYYQLLYTVK